jgi:hypothetical protein
MGLSDKAEKEMGENISNFLLFWCLFLILYIINYSAFIQVQKVCVTFVKGIVSQYSNELKVVGSVLSQIGATIFERYLTS